MLLSSSRKVVPNHQYLVRVTDRANAELLQPRSEFLELYLCLMYRCIEECLVTTIERGEIDGLHSRIKLRDAIILSFLVGIDQRTRGENLFKDLQGLRFQRPARTQAW